MPAPCRRLLGLLLTVACPTVAQEPAKPAAAEPRVTAPRADDDPELAPLLDKARAAARGGADGAALLQSKEFGPLRELSAFRALVRERAPVGEVRITLPGEPGRPLVVRGSVLDRSGAPVAGALVYAYHTSSEGWYSDRAPHFSGNGGDVGHARLFAYVRTDKAGRFVLHTIRPGGYPRSDLPEHIHVHVDAGGRPVFGGEILFDDDTRLGAEARAKLPRDFIVAKVGKDAQGLVVEPVLHVDVAGAAK
jgi:protocatechuate 3,4-dioxygenase beta subunit